MNSDPYDSAAWRTFGMLNDDEAAIFDEAARIDPVLRSACLEMDCLSTAIAVVTTPALEPREGQLERIQTRLGLVPRNRPGYWFGISGWAAAAVLAVLLWIEHRRPSTANDVPTTAMTGSGSDGSGVVAPSPNQTDLPQVPPQPSTGDSPKEANGVQPIAGKDGESKASVRAETKRLVQEIAVLRDNLEKFQHRDRLLFEPVPGRAMPIVMTMNPPGVPLADAASVVKSEDSSPIASMLGDAVRVMTAGTATLENGSAAPGEGAVPALASDHAMAIPIYDSARDSGTLVVNNLPVPAEGEVYNLWVTTVSGGTPIYVGSLPASSVTGADSFDFSLGSNMVLPSGFLLTRDPINEPMKPSASNTVLQGPPGPGD